ncbi:unnamed protein product [Phytomonas sp. Hart1]|nr:unnamed protein product [Phytomonas sp. Hart1]|eukprot:CCW66199.1 unnamed protein product [Phytomonas sp. isolate Hart1]
MSITSRINSNGMRIVRAGKVTETPGGDPHPRGIPGAGDLMKLFLFLVLIHSVDDGNDGNRKKDRSAFDQTAKTVYLSRMRIRHEHPEYRRYYRHYGKNLNHQILFNRFYSEAPNRISWRRGEDIRAIPQPAMRYRGFINSISSIPGRKRRYGHGSVWLSFLNHADVKLLQDALRPSKKLI